MCVWVVVCEWFVCCVDGGGLARSGYGEGMEEETEDVRKNIHKQFKKIHKIIIPASTQKHN